MIIGCFFTYFYCCEFNNSFHPPLVAVVIIVRMYSTSSPPLQARGSGKEVVVMGARPLQLI